jgi:hypothetical protein
MLEVVLKDWVTETKETACSSKSSHELGKSQATLSAGRPYDDDRSLGRTRSEGLQAGCPGSAGSPHHQPFRDARQPSGFTLM